MGPRVYECVSRGRSGGSFTAPAGAILCQSFGFLYILLKVSFGHLCAGISLAEQIIVLGYMYYQQLKA
jgi:hypothetical protein